MATPSVKPVLLSRDQIEQLRVLQGRSVKNPLWASLQQFMSSHVS